MIWWLLATLVVGIVFGIASCIAYIMWYFYKEGL